MEVSQEYGMEGSKRIKRKRKDRLASGGGGMSLKAFVSLAMDRPWRKRYAE